MADEICADCGRPMARTFGVWSQQRGSVLCGAGKHDAAADLQCAEVKIERLESQLAAAENLNAAERAVVEAAVASIDASKCASAIYDRDGHGATYLVADAEILPRARAVAKAANALLDLRAEAKRV